MSKKTCGEVISREFLAAVPKQPGVYLMLDSTGKVIYVGKALDLRKRLASYQRQRQEEHDKTGVMLAKVGKIEFIITNTEKEALILEASLIKKHKPKYNIILRDDKNYPLIKVTVNEEWPRVLMTRRRSQDGARYFGPYSSPTAMWESLKYLQSIYPLRRCKTKKLAVRRRPCLNQQLNRCPGPCVGKADAEEYKENVARIVMVLSGRGAAVISELQKKMQSASLRLAFEEAALCRDQIKSLVKTLERQVITSFHDRDQDVFGLSRQGSAVALAVLFVRHGVVTGQKPFYFTELLEDDSHLIAEAVRQFYSMDNPVPDEILLPCSAAQKNPLVEWLQEVRKARVVIKTPRQGGRGELVQMANANAHQIHQEKGKRDQDWQRLGAAMVSQLHLERLPNRIECLDISNISGKMAVGSLVCFSEGVKEGSGYRKYTIRQVQGPDDYLMMEEVLRRRFAKAPFPDLLVVDGGKGQLNKAVKVLQDLGPQQEIALLGIAKERKDEGDKIYKPGRKNPIMLAPHSPVLLFLMRVRDEAHRFGITFHRSLRQKQAFTSKLDSIPGIGPVRKKALLQAMGSLEQVAQASEKRLSEIPGIGADAAAGIYHYFHPEQTEESK